MGDSKNGRKILKLLGFSLYKIYKSTQKKTDVSKPLPLPLPLPLLPLISPQNILYSNMLLTYAVMSGLTILMFKDLIDSSNRIKNLLDLSNRIKNLLDLANQNENLPKLPLNIPLFEKQPEKRILAVHVCCPLCPQRSVGRYVVFKEKNKDNSSLVNITPGEIGQIIKKLKGWDEALVDFSIKVPSRFQKLDTKSIIANIFNEGVVIVE